METQIFPHHQSSPPTVFFGYIPPGILELDYKSCEMIADELAKYIKDHYPGRFMKIEVSEDGENGCTIMFPPEK